MTIEQLKAEAYDLIAQREAHLREAERILQMLNAKNQEITEFKKVPDTGAGVER